MAQNEPAQRAGVAAEQLGAEGAAVTARAVRERAGVSMTVAVVAAREWNEQQARAVQIPEAPEVVQARFQAIWREAVLAARGEFAQQRDGWVLRVEQAETERAALAHDLAAVEAERDQARAGAVSAAQAAEVAARELEQQVVALRSRADRAEARLEAVEAERDRVITERDAAAAERDKAVAERDTAIVARDKAAAKRMQAEQRS